MRVCLATQIIITTARVSHTFIMPSTRYPAMTSVLSESKPHCVPPRCPLPVPPRAAANVVLPRCCHGSSVVVVPRCSVPLGVLPRRLLLLVGELLRLIPQRSTVRVQNGPVLVPCRCASR